MTSPDRLILHADVDAFFASVEARDRPELADRPFAVVTEIGTGVIACGSYPARAYGIHGGMTVRQATARCPQLELVEGRYGSYREASEQVFALFRRYATAIQPGSMEEAFLDVGDREPVVTAARLRREARVEIGLPLSIGVGRTKLVAKIASRRAKPDGLVVIVGDDEQRLRDELRIADVWGVGTTTRERLCDIGIHTVRDLDGIDVAMLASVVGLAMARRLTSIALGSDDAAVTAPRPGRLISGERSVTPVSRSAARVGEFLHAAAASALARLHERGRNAGRAEVAVVYDDQQSTAVRSVVPVPTSDADVLHALARDLLARTGFADDGRGVARVRLTLTLATIRASVTGSARPTGRAASDLPVPTPEPQLFLFGTV